MATIHGMLDATVRDCPGAIALTHGDRHVSYAELSAAADRTAAFLAGMGVGRGDRVALLMENSVDYVADFFGALRAGACVVALNHANRAQTHRKLLQDSGAVGLLTRGREARKLPEIVADCPDLRFGVIDRRHPKWELPASLDLHGVEDVANSAETPPAFDLGADDLAVILYTSGSTGTPRGVTLTHGNLTANTEQILAYLPLEPKDSICCVLPFHYSFGNSLLLTHIKRGGRVVIDNRFAFPQKVLETLVAERCTGFSGVPSHFAILCARTEFLDMPHEHLRYLTQAGGAMSPALTRRIRETLPDRISLYVMYGQTEASARLSWLPPDRLIDKYGSIGVGIPGVSLTVRRADGSECDPREEGEIVASGPNIMQGYWKDPAETARVLFPDGLHTGDLGYRDEEGFIFIVDRAKNMIKAGANRVSAKEIEDAILELETVIETCVVGVPDELLGEAIEAWVVTRDPNDKDDQAILRHCLKRLAQFKVPRTIHFTDALPKNSFGKVLKRELRPQR